MNADYEAALGSRIRRLREKQKMTQEAVAAQMQLRGCDITRSAVAKIEVGQRHIYPDELLFLKEILNTTFDELFYEP